MTMRSLTQALLTSLSFLSFVAATTGCRERGEVCIETDSDTVEVNTVVTVSSCGDEVTTDRITVELDWGDGTVSPGQTGSHTYVAVGAYVIRVLVNGEVATEEADADPADVEINITVI